MFTLKVKGLEKLQRQVKEMERSLRSLGGRIASIEFDSNDDQAVRRAVSQMERAVDAKVARFKRNPMVQQLAASMKDACRKDILERAAKARQQ